MSVQFNQQRAEVIIDFFRAHNFERKVTFDHFKEQGVSYSTVRNVLNRFNSDGRVQFKTKTGRPRTVLTKNNIKKIETQFYKSPSTSVRKITAKINISVSSVQRAKREIGIRTRRKQKAPKHNENQRRRAELACRKLYKKTVPSGGNHFMIMDDETYVPIDGTQIPGLEFYNELPNQVLPIDAKIKKTQKFPRKFLVWQAIAEDGSVSSPFITTRTMNADIYLRECVKKRLIPFIESFGNEKKILFWPDMASSHYAGIVVAELEKKNIEFVIKSSNGPNLPHVRPIEKFWALCKTAYKSRIRACTTLKGFKRVWKNLSDKIAKESGKNLFSSFRKNLYSAGHRGVLSPLNI